MRRRNRTTGITSTASVPTDKSQTSYADLEPYVDADAIALFIDDTRRNVLRMVREGKLTCYPLSGSKRHTYKFKKSEVQKDLERLRRPSGTVSEETSRAPDTKK